MLNRWDSRWLRFRTLRWALAAAIVFALAHIGHSAAGQTPADAGAHVLTSLGALGGALLMALLAAYLTVRR